MQPTHPPATAASIFRPNADRWLWFLAVPAMVLGSLAIVKFAVSNSVEGQLFRAAAAAAEEATLPRASRTSVALAAQRSLARDGCAAISPIVELEINARPATGRWIDCRSGDAVSVTLTAERHGPTCEVLHRLGIPWPNSLLSVTATLRKR